MLLSCPTPPKSVSQQYVQFFRAGFQLGSTPDHPFDPDLKWSPSERQAYAVGFDMGMDALSDVQASH